MNHFTVMDIRSQILSLLGSVKRPGMDALLAFVESSNYFTVNCNGHHFIGKGGMAEHSIEVYTFMKEHNLNGARIQLQLHKFIWNPDKRGV